MIGYLLGAALNAATMLAMFAFHRDLDSLANTLLIGQCTHAAIYGFFVLKKSLDDIKAKLEDNNG